MIKEEKFVNFCIRMRGGGGDRYMGGSVGLVHCPDRTEVLSGQDGQLITILDITVNPDSTVIVHAVGDLPFRVRNAWIPRGLRGVQCAVVDVEQAAHVMDTILETCDGEASLRRFSRLIRVAAPSLADMLAHPSGKFTVFVPTSRALDATFGNASDEDLAADPKVEAMLTSHVIEGKVPCEALYNGRVLTAIDGSALIVTFKTWPRSDARVNDMPIDHMDVMCANGVMHIVSAVNIPTPAPTRRGR